MNDLYVSLMIAAFWILLAVGAVYGRDAVMFLRAARKPRKPKRSDLLASWPHDVVLPCQSWLGQEIAESVKESEE